MHIHNQITREFIKTLQFGSFSLPSNLTKMEKMPTYTWNWIPTEAHSSHYIQGLVSASSSIKPHLHSSVKRDLRSIWVCNRNHS
jgi:hypothetical protein